MKPDWGELRRLYPSPGFLTEPVTLFVAEELDEGEHDLDDGEEPEIARLAPEKVETTLRELEDGKTLAGVLRSCCANAPGYDGLTRAATCATEGRRR